MSRDQHPALGPEREALRARNGVRALTNAEEGHDVKSLPTGIYGFTAAPAAHELPLFSTPIIYGTEVHKTADGEVYLIGYVKPDEAQTIEGGSEPLHVSLFPEPTEVSSSLVMLPMSRIDRRHPPTRSDGNSMAVEFGPKL